MAALTLGDTRSFAINALLPAIQSGIQEVADGPLLQVMLGRLVQTVQLLVEFLCGLIHE